MRYEFLRDVSSDDIYAVQFDETEDIIGAYGPIDFALCDPEALPSYPYQEETAVAVREMADQYMLELVAL